MEIGFTLERGRLAQELCDKGWSFDRVAIEVEVSRYAIEKWYRQGLIRPSNAIKRKKLTHKMLMAQQMLNEKIPASQIIKELEITYRTLVRWVKEGKIK